MKRKQKKSTKQGNELVKLLLQGLIDLAVAVLASLIVDKING